MASLIDRASQYATKDELNIFKLPVTQIGAERSRYVTVFPKNNVEETNVDSVITFEISGVPDYLDLHKNFLKVRFQVRRLNGDPLVANENVAPSSFSK